MKLCDKLVAINALINGVAVHTPTVEDYAKLMEGTYDSKVLETMWKKYGATTCVSVNDQTSSEELPPSRMMGAVEDLRARGFEILTVLELENYPEDKLYKFLRGNRVLVTGTLVDTVYDSAPAAVNGLKPKHQDGVWVYEVYMTSTHETVEVTEDMLAINADHRANMSHEDTVADAKRRVRG